MSIVPDHGIEVKAGVDIENRIDQRRPGRSEKGPIEPPTPCPALLQDASIVFSGSGETRVCAAENAALRG